MYYNIYYWIWKDINKNLQCSRFYSSVPMLLTLLRTANRNWDTGASKYTASINKILGRQSKLRKIEIDETNTITRLFIMYLLTDKLFIFSRHWVLVFFWGERILSISPCVLRGPGIIYNIAIKGRMRMEFNLETTTGKLYWQDPNSPPVQQKCIFGHFRPFRN